MQNIATLQRITRERLSTILLSPQSSNIAIVDVRDDDHVGGHIRFSIHLPSSTFNHRIGETIDLLADKNIVIFHCALSQQRGPGAALNYLRERDLRFKTPTRFVAQEEMNDSKTEKGAENRELEKDNEKKRVEVTDHVDAVSTSSKTGSQEVFVLDGGFVKWQEK